MKNLSYQAGNATLPSKVKTPTVQLFLTETTQEKNLYILETLSPKWVLSAAIRYWLPAIESRWKISLSKVGQAVALHTEGDQIIVRNCRLKGNQDTVFTGNEKSRVYFENCYIDGTTDFIFGPATCWFENCEIFSKQNSYITAASSAQENPFGYVFHNCRLAAADNVTKVYLGRPWRAYAAVTFIKCDLGRQIRPEGWENWRNPENEKTARYSEYKNHGEGASTEKRVSWSRQLSKKEAKQYTRENVLGGNWWQNN